MPGRGVRPVPGRRVGRLVRRAAVTLAALAAATAAAPPAATVPHGVPSGAASGPAGLSRELRGVRATGPHTAWAVGHEEDAQGRAPLVEQFDGRAWRRVTVPGGPGGLDAVLPLGRRDVWAVGSATGPAGDRGLALHFDGRAWREVPLPDEPTGRSAHPFALTGDADGVWAVGAGTGERTADPRPLAYRWDGAAWHRTDVPAPGGDAVLLAAASDGAGGVWAVGAAYDPDGTGRPLAAHWDGTAWRLVEVPSTDGASTTLEAVAAFAPDDVWAAGGTGPADGPTEPVLLHWDGVRWRPAPAPGAVDGALHALDAAADGTLWAAGERPSGGPGVARRGRGGRWSYPPAGREASGESAASLLSVAAVPGTDGAWAVGATPPQLGDAWQAVTEWHRPPR
ncbi:hypothetical protein KNE206_35110 [Kitasatospora sp. NE20-6]